VCGLIYAVLERPLYKFICMLSFILNLAVFAL
jgi:hypothetical protein